jgi:hypothetical protein
VVHPPGGGPATFAPAPRLATDRTIDFLRYHLS